MVVLKVPGMSAENDVASKVSLIGPTTSRTVVGL